MMNNTNREQKEFLLKKNQGKRLKASYLSELEQLLSSKFDLLTLEETESLIEGTRNIRDKNRYKIITPFPNKSSLKKFIELVAENNDDIIYLYTDYSKFCGMVRIKSIKEFNTDFDFDDEHGGLIELQDEKAQNGLILDFFEENGTQKLEMETYGEDWSKFLQRAEQLCNG